jgi:hypothetical protein
MICRSDMVRAALSATGRFQTLIMDSPPRGPADRAGARGPCGSWSWPHRDRAGTEPWGGGFAGPRCGWGNWKSGKPDDPRMSSFGDSPKAFLLWLGIESWRAKDEPDSGD